MKARLRRFFVRFKKRSPTPHGSSEWRATLKRRVAIAAWIFALWATGIEARLVYLQVVEHDELVARAERQHRQKVPLPAKRGDILDRKGRVLATSVDADSIYAVPSEIADPALAVRELCTAFGDCTPRERQTLVERFSRRSPFAYVRRHVSPEEARRVAALNLAGVGFIKESRRRYPKKELAAHVLGYVGTDNKGLGGVEFAYDTQIRGKDGQVLIQTDARRHAFNRFERPPTSGSSIELTLDEYLQHVAERELRAAVAENRAAGGTAVIMNPRTGEILAMANEPTFNPNLFREATDPERRNRAVQDLYEPGSTFKIVTAAAAIEEKVLPLETMIDTSPGYIRINASHVIDEWRGKNHGVLSFMDVIVKSSNVGAIKVGFKVGTERLSRYVDRFGFGRPISPDFPGESPGIVWSPEKWTDSALASVSMGYQVAVTPMQMATAVSSVANGGELIEPRIVRAVYKDDRRLAVRPKSIGRSVTPDTAATLTTVMEEVVKRGTAKLAQIPGYTVAGKTGTASKLIGGRYSASENNVSFVGFVPSRDPVATIIVVIDSPHSSSNSGGAVSAPVFKNIAEAALRYLGVAPTIDAPPPVLVARRDRREEPAPVVVQPTVTLVAGERSDVVPDVRGMSAREAMRTLVRLGLSAQMSGSGVVVSQEPLPGSPLQPGARCRLVLDRRPLALQTADAGRDRASGVAEP